MQISKEEHDQRVLRFRANKLHVNIEELQQKRAFGYIRVSTDMQVKNGSSLEAQRASIQDYCSRNRLNLIDIMADNGISGKDMDNRDGLLHLIATVRHSDTVVVYSISRLGRNARDIENIVSDFHNNHVNLVALDSSIDFTHESGRLAFNLLNQINESERRTTAERTSATLLDMSHRGKLKTRPRFGKKVELRTFTDQNGKIYTKNIHVDCPEEQEVLQAIRFYIQEYPRITPSEISRRLTDDGFSIRNSKKIYPGTITKIITDNDLRNLTPPQQLQSPSPPQLPIQSESPPQIQSPPSPPSSSIYIPPIRQNQPLSHPFTQKPIVFHPSIPNLRL